MGNTYDKLRKAVAKARVNELNRESNRIYGAEKRNFDRTSRNYRLIAYMVAGALAIYSAIALVKSKPLMEDLGTHFEDRIENATGIHDSDYERVYSTSNGTDYDLIYEKRVGDEVLRKVVGQAYIKPDYIRIKDVDEDKTLDLVLTWNVNGKMLVETIDDFLNDKKE